MTANDRQEGGGHYVTQEIQPWDVCAAYGLDFFDGNVVKYMLRKKEHENELERYKKARHYLDKKIELLEAAGQHSITMISHEEHERRQKESPPPE